MSCCFGYFVHIEYVQIISCALIVIQLQMHKITLYLHAQIEQDSNAQILEPDNTKSRCHSKNTPRFFGTLIIVSFLKNFVPISECRYR